jgi:hypothetical protein
MPIQKGKKRRRPRRRGSYNDNGAVEPSAPAVPAQPKPSARPIMRKGFQPPMWVNILIGAVLCVVGIIFYLLPQKGMGSGTHLIILLGYFALGGLYFGKAFRQYRAKRQS